MARKKAKKRTKAQNRAHYKKYQSSPARRKYRAELNRRARKMGVYGKRRKMGKDLVHKKGKIAGLGSRKANRRDGQRKSVKSRRRNSRRRK